MRVFLEKHGAAAHLYIFGAGHVAKELAALAHRVGFRVHVVDERREWANRERFPDAELNLENPADVARALAGGADCYFCVTTHDHPLDQACVEALLRKPAAYVGVIGSRRKAERFKMRLQAPAASRTTEIDRMKSPMGAPSARSRRRRLRSPSSAELISVRRGGRES